MMRELRALGAEVHWLYHGIGRFFPEEWARFRGGVPEPDLVASSTTLIPGFVLIAATDRFAELRTG